jgi:hypothetical protein
MPRTIAVEDLLNRLIDGIADRITSRVEGQLKASGRGRGAGQGRRGRPGKKLDMSCRVEGCKNLSRGPRFGFICDEHRKKLSKKDQAAARDAWKTRATAA